MRCMERRVRDQRARKKEIARCGDVVAGFIPKEGNREQADAEDDGREKDENDGRNGDIRSGAIQVLFRCQLRSSFAEFGQRRVLSTTGTLSDERTRTPPFTSP